MDKSRQNETDVAASKAMANQDFTDSPNLMSIHPPGLQLKANGNSEASNQEEKIDGKTSLAAVKEFTAADPPNDADINTVQAKSKDAPTSVFQLQEKTNNTGLPNNLKSGVENLSGYSLDDVQVHYNSNKPAHLQVHAYAQGTDIHVASGK